MITYAQEIKKEHYPYTAKDSSTGSYKWSNPQNAISNSDNYAQCSTGWNSKSNLDNNKTIYLGANDIQNIYLGNNAVSSVYLGNSLIYGNTKDEIIESNGIIAEGLTLYLDGRDYVKNSDKWNSRAGSDSVDFSYPSSVPSKVGNCVKMNSSSYGFCYGNPFVNKVSTFTLELYIKDISIIPNDNMHLMSITKTLEYGIFVTAEGPDYRETGQTELGVSIYNGSTFNFYYPTKVTSNSSVYVQITCLNGKLDLYIDGNLVSTANNFSMQMPSQNTAEVALLLGNYGKNISSFEPTFASVRYYVRSLTKDELENNRNFDLSIY